MIKNKLDAIILDFDGVLVNPSERLYRVYKILHQKFGFQPACTKKQYWELKRQRVSEIDIARKSCMTKKMLTRYSKERYRIIEQKKFLAYDVITVGSKKTLAFLQRRAPLILATYRKNARNFYHELKHLRLEKYFTKILVAKKRGRDVVKEKIGLLHSVRGQKALMVGDTENEITVGKTLGFITIAIDTGMRNRNLLARENPDFLIKNLSQLNTILTSSKLYAKLH